MKKQLGLASSNNLRDIPELASDSLDILTQPVSQQFKRGYDKADIDEKAPEDVDELAAMLQKPLKPAIDIGDEEELLDPLGVDDEQDVLSEAPDLHRGQNKPQETPVAQSNGNRGFFFDK